MSRLAIAACIFSFAGTALAQATCTRDEVEAATASYVTEGGHPYAIGTRLYLDGGKVTRIYSLVTDEGDWLFNANAYLRYSSAENWSAPTADQRSTEAELVHGANVFCRFGNSETGMPDSHTFRMIDGKYRYVHTLSVNLNPDRPSPQANDDGSMRQ